MPTYTRNVKTSGGNSLPQQGYQTQGFTDTLYRQLIRNPARGISPSNITQPPNGYRDGTGDHDGTAPATSDARGVTATWGTTTGNAGSRSRSVTITVPNAGVPYANAFIAGNNETSASIDVYAPALLIADNKTAVVMDGADYLLTVYYSSAYLSYSNLGDYENAPGGVPTVQVTWNGQTFAPESVMAATLQDVPRVTHKIVIRLSRSIIHNSEAVIAATAPDGFQAPALHLQWIEPWVDLTLTAMDENGVNADASSAWSPTGYIKSVKWNYQAYGDNGSGQARTLTTSTDPDRGPLIQDFDFSNDIPNDTNRNASVNVTVSDDKSTAATAYHFGNVVLGANPDSAATLRELPGLGRVWVAFPDGKQIRINTLQREANAGPFTVKETYAIGNARFPILLRTPNGMVICSVLVTFSGQTFYNAFKTYNGREWTPMSGSEWTEPYTGKIVARDALCSPDIPGLCFIAYMYTDKTVHVWYTLNSGVSWKEFTNIAFTSATMATVALLAVSGSEVAVTTGTTFRSTRDYGVNWV